jgi:hypothetical protein
MTNAATTLAARAAGTVRGTIAKVGGRRGPQAAIQPSNPGVTPELAQLVYELLDAHADTAELASALDLDHDWLAHLDYLRALQRHCRRVLAETSAT